MPTKKKAAPKKTSAAKKTAKHAAKKTAKKAAKKTAKKKGKDLVRAHGVHCFWMSSGEVLADLLELRDALSTMSEDAFKHHVTKDKNDFADWVQTVLADPTLAKALRSSKKPSTARTVVVKRLRIYNF